MNKRVFKILSLLLTVTMAFSAAQCAVFAETTDKNSGTEITVSASDIKKKGAFKAIQLALNNARKSAKKDKPYKVTVEPGKYMLKAGLHVYSYTTLSLYNVTLMRDSEASCNMIRAGADTAVNKGDTGYGANVNIRVEGGTLDGGATSNTMVKVAHATNFVMSGTKLQNLRNAHMMEIAGVNGFTIQNCSFKNQLLDVDEVGYEAIQLDVLKEGHIFGCRSEALPMKNVRIEGSYFDNVPRAIGTHTAILNCPFDGIKIKDNTFKNLKSAVIQAQNWINCEISGNTIEKTPRAITIYSVFEEGHGCYKAGILAREGNTKTSISESYQKPKKANIVIADNTIKNCGTFKDVYASYDPAAISVIGAKLKTEGRLRDDGSGVIPKGDYYLDGVTVKNNEIVTTGNAVYLNDIRGASVTGNIIKCVKSDFYSKKSLPVSTVDSSVGKIENNTVNASPNNGFDFSNSTVGTVKGNSIYNVSQSAIALGNSSTITGDVSGNCVSKAAYALYVPAKCAVKKTVSGNIFDSCSKGMLAKAKNATAKLGSNYDKIVPVSKITLSKSKAELGDGEKLKLSLSYEPKNVIAKFTWSSSDKSIASVNSSGEITANNIGTATITAKAHSGKTAKCEVTVKPAPEAITVCDNMMTIGAGEKVDLKASIPEGTASEIKVTSNNTSAVSVSSGVMQGQGIGTATVVASTFNDRHANCNVIVKEAPYDIWFNTRGLDLGVGETYQLSLQLPYGSASHSIKYESDNNDAVSVTQSGYISAKAEGEATVTATAFNGAVAICNVHVRRVPESVAFEEEEYSTIVGEELTPVVVLTEGTASKELSFQSSDPDICHVDKRTGALTPKKKGRVTITVKTYNYLIATCIVAVN